MLNKRPKKSFWKSYDNDEELLSVYFHWNEIKEFYNLFICCVTKLVQEK
jgi:hypothetical protein